MDRDQREQFVNQRLESILEALKPILREIIWEMYFASEEILKMADWTSPKVPQELVSEEFENLTDKDWKMIENTRFFDSTHSPSRRDRTIKNLLIAKKTGIHEQDFPHRKSGNAVHPSWYMDVFNSSLASRKLPYLLKKIIRRDGTYYQLLRKVSKPASS